MKEKLTQALTTIVKGLVQENIKVELTVPNDNKNGDYATNVAFQLSKKLGKSPLDVAEQIVKDFALKMQDLGIEKVEAVKPGFVNFTLSQEQLINLVDEVLNAPTKVGGTTQMAGKKMIVEFTDPNPFKELHIGHVYSNTIGEALSRLLESQGAEVKRACYQGDVGLHVAKALWGMAELASEMPSEESSLSEKAKFLGKAYAVGAKAYEEDENAKKEITELNKKVYLKDPTIMQQYEKGRAWSLEYFDSLYARLGMHFDYFYFESVAGPIGLEYVKEHIADGTFEEDQGAVIFRGEKYGLHNRVFINSQGLPTYEAKELGLAPTKYKDYPYDQAIIITGNEINEYFNVLLKVLSLVNPDLASKTKHMGHGMVRLPEGKMSSRTGNVITGEWVLDEAKRQAEGKIKEQVKTSDLTPQEEEKITEQVGVGAVKYAFLKSGIGKDVSFSFEESVSFDGNAGPYLQYTYVRTQSVLAKAGSIVPQAQLSIHYTPAEEELLVLRKLVHFSGVVEQAARTYSPNVVTEYLFELAQLFNNFYQKYRIVNASVEEERVFRLRLTKAVGIIIKQGLYLLGIATPEKM